MLKNLVIMLMLHAHKCFNYADFFFLMLSFSYILLTLCSCRACIRSILKCYMDSSANTIKVVEESPDQASRA